MVKTTAVVPEEQHFTLASLSPRQAQRRLAVAVVVALVGAFFMAAGPLSTIQLGRIDAFVPAYATAMFVIDSITAVLAARPKRAALAFATETVGALTCELVHTL